MQLLMTISQVFNRIKNKTAAGHAYYETVCILNVLILSHFP